MLESDRRRWGEDDARLAGAAGSTSGGVREYGGGLLLGALILPTAVVRRPRGWIFRGLGELLTVCERRQGVVLGGRESEDRGKLGLVWRAWSGVN